METNDPVLAEILKRLDSIESRIISLQPLQDLYSGGKVAAKILGIIVAFFVALGSFIAWVKTHLMVSLK
jgi:hypothetical protein